MSQDREWGTFLTHHVVVPAAVIAMVASFLFFLVDLRSAYLGGGPSLKWIGFCFVVAAVLNERYAGSEEADRQGFYTLALAAATTLALLVAPWETPPGGWEQKLANLLILAVIWHLATRVTRGLSPERKDRPGILAQLDLLFIDPWRKEDVERPLKPPPARPRNPAVMVARLAAAALLVFALGEPIVLEAAPQTGPKALAAVVVFLFSTGVVLAAGSALDALRRAEAAGARVTPGLVPGRMALAALLLGVVLAAALAMPGLSFQGSGRLRPPVTQGEGEEEERGNQETEDAGQPGGEILGDVVGNEMPSNEGEPLNEASALGAHDEDPRVFSSLGSADGLPGWLAGVGILLLILLGLSFLALGLRKLVRRWRRPAKGRAGGRPSLQDRLARLLSRRRDPLAGLDELAERPSREAVLAAYRRFLSLLETLGHSRPPRATPYVTLHGLPPHLDLLGGPAQTLTDLYVLAAYAAEPVEPAAPERAIAALREMRGLLDLMERTKAASSP